VDGRKRERKGMWRWVGEVGAMVGQRWKEGVEGKRGFVVRQKEYVTFLCSSANQEVVYVEEATRPAFNLAYKCTVGHNSINREGIWIYSRLII
jgi:hypothetical protein